MAGIYIHVPFCKTRCIYCDFYSGTQTELKQRYIRALCRELEARQTYLKSSPVETVYFGGGTPSLLTAHDFEAIFHTLARVYGLCGASEITLEANPDDLSPEYLQTLSSLPFNRISIGIQTFDDATLRLLHRRHTAAQAIQAVTNCRQAGFDNLSIDLMYGLPNQNAQMLLADLRQAVALQPEHLSAYHLTYEENTPIYTMLQNRPAMEPDEEESLHFFNLTVDTLLAAGYEHYELSNFCRPHRHSRHNSSYWDGTMYLGCGPSAHSYNGSSREWNVASLLDYITGMEKNERVYESEEPDTPTRYNDFVITGLRTCKGISLPQLEALFGTAYLTHCLDAARKHIESGTLEVVEDRLKLTRRGMFISDGIMSDLLYTT